MQTDPEQSDSWKRYLAKQHTGVRFDARSKKYVASIMIDRVRRHLGSFETPDAAGEIYKLVRAKHPKRSASQNAFGTLNACWQDFVSQAQRNKKGFIIPGQYFFTPDNQGFELFAIDIRPGKFGKWVFFKWKSACSVCGAEYETTTRGRAKKLRGIVRTCPAHRGQHKHRRQDPAEGLV